MCSFKKQFLLKKLDHVVEEKRQLDSYAEEFFTEYMNRVCAAALLCSSEKKKKELEAAEIWNVYNDLSNKSMLLQLKHLRITRRILSLK